MERARSSSAGRGRLNPPPDDAPLELDPDAMQVDDVGAVGDGARMHNPAAEQPVAPPTTPTLTFAFSLPAELKQRHREQDFVPLSSFFSAPNDDEPKANFTTWEKFSKAFVTGPDADSELHVLQENGQLVRSIKVAAWPVILKSC